MGCMVVVSETRLRLLLFVCGISPLLCFMIVLRVSDVLRFFAKSQRTHCALACLLARGRRQNFPPHWWNPLCPSWWRSFPPHLSWWRPTLKLGERQAYVEIVDFFDHNQSERHGFQYFCVFHNQSERHGSQSKREAFFWSQSKLSATSSGRAFQPTNKSN